MPADYTLAELEALTGLPGRTIRYYIAQGLVPSPGREGPSTRYAEGTLQRLRLIGRLRDAHLPLAAIRSRLSNLDDAAVADLLAEPASAEPPGGDSALDYVRRLLGGSPAAAAASILAPAPVPPAMAPAAAPSMPAPAHRLREEAGPAYQTLRRAIPSAPAAGAAPEPPPVPPAATPPAPSPAAPASAGPSFGERSQWERIAITNDIELHVRRPLTRADNRLVERLLAFARQLQEDTK